MRPQDMVIGEAGPDSLQAEIVSVRRSGPTRRAEISIGAQTENVEVDTPSSVVYRPGEQVPVRILRGAFFLNGEGI